MAFPVIFISILASMWPGTKKCLPSGVSVAVGSLAGLLAAWLLITAEGDYV